MRGPVVSGKWLVVSRRGALLSLSSNTPIAPLRGERGFLVKRETQEIEKMTHPSPAASAATSPGAHSTHQELCIGSLRVPRERWELGETA